MYMHYVKALQMIDITGNHTSKKLYLKVGASPYSMPGHVKPSMLCIQ